MTQSDLRFGEDIRRGRPVEIEVDGKAQTAYEGETIAAALLAAGVRVLHMTASRAPRGVYCGMGVCHGCLVTVNGVPNVRACATLVAPGLKISTQHGAGWVQGTLDASG